MRFFINFKSVVKTARKQSHRMKFIILTFCVFFAAVNGFDPDHDLEDKTFKECLAENNIKKEEMPGPLKRHHPNFRCVMSCIFEKRGILKDGAIDVETVITQIESVVKQLTKEKITEIMTSCVEEGKDKADKCEMVNAVTHCARKEFHKLFQSASDNEE